VWFYDWERERAFDPILDAPMMAAIRDELAERGVLID
jgi:hypothetical protein